MSASQHTIAHVHKSTSDIQLNGFAFPDHNRHQHHRYENIVLDLVESDILSVLPSHLKAVVLLGAGLANSDNRDGRYRSFYFRQGWTAQKLGISRQALSSYLGAMVEHGVLVKLGKGHPKNRRKGAQPVIFYAVPEFEALCRLADTKTKDDFTRKKSPADVARIVDNAERVSTTVLQPPAGKVSSGRDTLLSSERDTLSGRLSTGRDTKIDLLPEIENGKEVHPSENGDNIKDNTNGHSGGDVADGQSEILCSCGNAIPAEKWAAGREVCKECWEKEQRAAHAVWKRGEEENRRKQEEACRAFFREKWAHVDEGKRADKLWMGADFATRGRVAGLGAAAD
ncbi:MAG: hypothetical protein OXH93_13665 [Caldilineaceae bacterium]|nr:hypothetical protein [Caldilineaceae bacterium]